MYDFELKYFRDEMCVLIERERAQQLADIDAELRAMAVDFK